MEGGGIWYTGMLKQGTNKEKLWELGTKDNFGGEQGPPSLEDPRYLEHQ